MPLASYAGDIPVEEAWKILETEQDAQLIDVRTKAEWTFVGVPDLAKVDRQPILLEWQEYPSMEKNSGFAEALEAASIPKDAPLLFLCRSGQRSAPRGSTGDSAPLPSYLISMGDPSRSISAINSDRLRASV